MTEKQSVMNDDIFPVVVIGGGLAGLTAALHLAERDIPPLVLEADTEWAGGRLSGGADDTFEHQDRTWAFGSEHGAHALWGAYDNMRAMVRHFFDMELKLSEGEEWINRWGDRVRVIEAGNAVRSRWIPAPLHYLQLLLRPRFWATITPLDFLSFPGFAISVMMTVGFDPIKEEVPLDGLKMRDYFRGWTPNLRATFTGLGVNLLASNAEDINLTAFIAAIRFYTMLRRDSWQLEYLPGNAQDVLIGPMIDRINAVGKVEFGATAIRVERVDDHWKVAFEDARLGGIRTLETEHIIFATEPAAAQRILNNSPDTAEIAATIKFPEVTRCATIRIWFSKSPREGAPGGMMTGDFQIDNFFWLHKLHTEFFEWHRTTGGSAVEVHIYNRDELLDMSDQLVAITAATEIQRAFPELRGHLVHVAVRRNGMTQTQFRVPRQGESLFVETPWSGIFACGDWVGYPTPALWMERCIVTGIAAANAVLAAHEEEAFEIIPPRKPELPVRMIGGVVYALRRLFAPLILLVFRRKRQKVTT